MTRNMRRRVSHALGGSSAGYEQRILRQNGEPVVHPFGIGGVLPVRKEPRGIAEGQPAFDLVDLEREGDSLRGACPGGR